jgi:hypothetical protein
MGLTQLSTCLDLATRLQGLFLCVVIGKNIDCENICDILRAELGYS